MTSRQEPSEALPPVPPLALPGSRFRRWLRPLAPPLVLLALALVLWEPVAWWLQGEERYDRHALKEWLLEARTSTTLPQLVSKLLDAQEQARRAQGPDKAWAEQQVLQLREQIGVHLRALGEPVTKIYSSQLPLFPVIYHLEVYFDPPWDLKPIVWDSGLPRQTRQYRRLPHPIRLDERGAYADVSYHLRVYAWQQAQERQEADRRLRLGVVALVGSGLMLGWIYLDWRRQRRQEQQELRAQQRLHEAERRQLEEELRRQEAERRREEAERLNLELQSQLFAHISIMAGSYAHNIKNLLLRPSDLLARCLEQDQLAPAQTQMLQEVRQTLATVTERLQQILQTVRRDPCHVQRLRLDLNQLVRDLERTWGELAREKWKLNLTVELAPEPLWILGDYSHLQQALENLLFNARDATFEMRSHLREQARQQVSRQELAGAPAALASGKQALIEAAAWRGQVVVRTRRQETQALLEVQDNGIGMTDEVRQQCLQAHFSTKRDNALFAGQAAGMGLGLTFVHLVLERHQAALQITSAPLQGTTFRLLFPLLPGAAPPASG